MVSPLKRGDTTDTDTVILIPTLIPIDTNTLATRINAHFLGITVVSAGISVRVYPGIFKAYKLYAIFGQD